MATPLSGSPGQQAKPSAKSPRHQWAVIGAGLSMAALVIALLILLAARGLNRPAADFPANANVSARVAAALDPPDARRGAARLQEVSSDLLGDVTITFALLDAGHAEANHEAAIADTLAIFRAVYTSPERYRGGMVTVLGTSPDLRAGGSPAMPVLYASLPADLASGVNWARLSPAEFEAVATLRWMPAAMCQAWEVCGKAETK